MKCEKCGGEWIPPKSISISLTNCPFCGAPVLDADTAKGYTDMGEFLQYLVSLYGINLYNNQRKLNNLIADLYQGDERMKRVYRRAILDDSLSKRIYDLSQKPLNEREAYYNQIINQFSEANFYAVDFGKQVIESFVSGLQLEIMASISTKTTKEDGEWIDEFGVKYSADRKKLIRGNESLETYKIREGTVVICDGAWSCWNNDLGCWNNLCCITIPDSVISIGEYAFEGCTSLTSIIIPNSVTYIGKEAFYECESLTSITIPNSVTSIGEEAFDSCKSLTSIIIPNSVTSIGKYAFCGCKSLTSITIPNSVTSIGGCAFGGCHSLTSIAIPDSVTNIDGGTFGGCHSLTSITIPNSVTSIGEGAFSGCKSLTSITIPNSVTSIEDGVFLECELLTSITIPDSVTSIGEYAFRGCKSLTSITIPNSVTSIGKSTFYFCNLLTNIVIPKNTTEKFKQLLPKELHPLLKESSEVE